MSRRGASHAAARPSVQVVTSYTDARINLDRLLADLTFARVLTVQIVSPPGALHPFYHGEAENVDTGKKIFFHCKERVKVLGLRLAGVTLIDSPFGNTHVSYPPRFGDLIVGCSVDNSRPTPRLPYMLTGWCCNAAPLHELRRMVRHGTTLTREQLRHRLEQPATRAAESLTIDRSLSAEQRNHATCVLKYRDQLWALARLILFGDVAWLANASPDAVRLGTTVEAFVSEVATTLADEAIRKDFWAAKPLPPPAPVYSVPAYSALPPGAIPVYSTLPPGAVPVFPYPPLPEHTSASPMYAPTSPMYAPTSPMYAPADGPHTPPYAPADGPHTPPYAPLEPPSLLTL
jgi:hypothetical protein